MVHGWRNSNHLWNLVDVADTDGLSGVKLELEISLGDHPRHRDVHTTRAITIYDRVNRQAITIHHHAVTIYYHILTFHYTLRDHTRHGDLAAAMTIYYHAITAIRCRGPSFMRNHSPPRNLQQDYT